MTVETAREAARLLQDMDSLTAINEAIDKAPADANYSFSISRKGRGGGVLCSGTMPTQLIEEFKTAVKRAFVKTHQQLNDL